MRERPILFSDTRVRALLSGQQSQTRRIIKTQLLGPGQDNHEGCYGIDVMNIQLQGYRILGMENLSYHCPYGQPGDRLWVRETWRGPVIGSHDTEEYGRSPLRFRSPDYCQYRADTSAFRGATDNDEHSGWQAGIHMPRWASRIDLLIDRIRVEKIQNISDEDVIAEGVQTDSHFLNNFFTMHSEAVSPKDAYREQWALQYGGTSWEVDPWVWVIEFSRI